MEGSYPRSREIERHSVGSKNSNRVINASDDDDDKLNNSIGLLTFVLN